MQQRLIENHQQYQQRIAYHASFGYDGEQERAAVLAKAQPLQYPLLEVGTGKGYFTVQLARSSKHFVSIDISPEEQRIAALNCAYFKVQRKVSFHIGDAGMMPFPDQSFQMLVSVNVIHHLLHPYRVMDEMIRVLAVQGKIVLSDFNEEGFRLMDLMHKSEGRIHENHNVLLPDMCGYIEAQGFTVEKHITKHHYIVIARRGGVRT